MDIVSLPEFEGFDWDEGNIEKNWIAHKVTPQEAEQVFFNIPLVAVDDRKHLRGEKRYFARTNGCGPTVIHRLHVAQTTHTGHFRQRYE